MSEDQVKRKIQLCQDVLKVFDKITPGRSRDRGWMKYELHKSLTLLNAINTASYMRGPACGVSLEIIINAQRVNIESLEEALIIFNDAPNGNFEKDRGATL
jgi:hypothetical protein